MQSKKFPLTSIALLSCVLSQGGYGQDQLTNISEDKSRGNDNQMLMTSSPAFSPTQLHHMSTTNTSLDITHKRSSFKSKVDDGENRQVKYKEESMDYQVKVVAPLSEMITAGAKINYFSNDIQFADDFKLRSSDAEVNPFLNLSFAENFSVSIGQTWDFVKNANLTKNNETDGKDYDTWYLTRPTLGLGFHTQALELGVLMTGKDKDPGVKHNVQDKTYQPLPYYLADQYQVFGLFRVMDGVQIHGSVSFSDYNKSIDEESERRNITTEQKLKSSVGLVLSLAERDSISTNLSYKGSLADRSDARLNLVGRAINSYGVEFGYAHEFSKQAALSAVIGYQQGAGTQSYVETAQEKYAGNQLNLGVGTSIKI